MAYMVFDKCAGRTIEPITSITSYGRIVFNKGAAQQLVHKNFRRVLLMCDASNHKIGIKPVGKDEKRCSRL